MFALPFHCFNNSFEYFHFYYNENGASAIIGMLHVGYCIYKWLLMKISFPLIPMI